MSEVVLENIVEINGVSKDDSRFSEELKKLKDPKAKVKVIKEGVVKVTPCLLD